MGAGSQLTHPVQLGPDAIIKALFLRWTEKQPSMRLHVPLDGLERVTFSWRLRVAEHRQVQESKSSFQARLRHHCLFSLDVAACHRQDCYGIKRLPYT